MNWMAACRSVALAITVTALLASCSDRDIIGGEWHGVARIEVSPGRIQINDGDRAAVTVRALDAAGSVISVAENDSRFQITWSSSDSAVAQIEGIGSSVHVRAAGPGTARVSVNLTPRSRDASSDMKLTTSTEVLTLAVATATRASSGNGQTGIVGESLPENLAVSVVDRHGSGVAGVTVHFATPDGGALNPATATTDASGVARTSWRLGTRQGPQTVTASTETATSMVFEATASPAAPDTIRAIGGLTQKGSAGVALAGRLKARVADRYGNTIAGVPVTWQVLVGGGSLTPVSQTTDHDGTAEASWILGPSAGGQIARAAIGTLSTDFDAEAVPGAASRLEKISGDGQSGAVGSALGAQLVVRVLDTHGNTVPGSAVTWRVTAGGGSVSPATSTSDANGLARTTWTLGTAAGTGTVEATLGSASASFTSTASGGTTPPPTTPPPTNPPPAPTAPSRVTDVRVVSSTTNSVTLSWTAVADGNGGSALYAIRVGSPTISWGSASATERTIAAGTNGQPVTYTYTGLTAGTTYQFQLISYRGTLSVNAVFGERSNVVNATTAAPPPPAVASVTLTPSTHTFTAVGQTQQLSATARSASGATLTGVRFTWSSSNSSIVSVDTMGRMTARGAGSALVIACAAGCSAADTSNVVVNPPTPPAVTNITAAPAAHTFTAVGQTQQITATARDGSGNVVSGTQFTWTSTAPGVVSVDNMGRMTARAAGTAAIIVGTTCCNLADTVNAVVQPPPTSGGTPLFADGFESGNLSYAANGVSWTSGSRTAVTNERAYSGNYSLRFRYQAAPNGSDSHSEQRFRLPNIVPEIWLEWMLYVPQNFIIRDQDHFENNKIWSLWAGDYSTNRLIDTELTMEYFRQTDYEGMSRLSVAHGDANASTGRNDHERNNFRTLLFTPANRGTWIRIRVYAKLDRAGVVRMWRDNTLVYELKDWNLWGTGGINRFESGYLMGWANSGFTQQTDFYVDDVKIYNSNPGWQ